MEKNKVLYDALIKDGYDIGDYDSFSTNLKDSSKRKALYDAVGQEYDLGDYDAFEEKLGFKAAQKSEIPTLPEQPGYNFDAKPFKTASDKADDFINQAETFGQQAGNLQRITKENREDLKKKVGVAKEAVNEIGREQIEKDMAKEDAFRREHPFLSALMGVRGPNGPIDLPSSDMQTVSAAANKVRDMEATIEEAEKKGNTNFFAGAVRGMGEKLSDIRTWDSGVLEGLNNNALLEAVRQSDKDMAAFFDKDENVDTKTKGQNALLDVAALEGAVNDTFAGDLGRGYKAGKVTAESLPFMIQMATNPAGTTGRAMGIEVAKRFGKEGLKTIGYKAAKIGARAIGDVAGAAIMTGTTGVPAVMADATRRQVGNVIPSTEGYAGRIEALDYGEALVKAYGSQTIENYSEMFGAYFSPMKKIAGATASNTMGKIGLGKVNELLKGLNTSDMARIVKDITKQTQWNGMFEEYAEEVVGMVLNNVLIGDTTNADLVSLDQHIDTFLGVSLMGGAISALKIGGYRTPKYNAKKALSAADKEASSIEGWEGLRTLLDTADDEKVKEILLALPEESRAPAYRYASALYKYRGVNVTDVARREDGTVSPEDASIEDAFEAGVETAMSDAEAKRALRKAYEDIMAETPAGLVEFAEKIESGKASWDDLYDDDKAEVEQYLSAKSAYEGLIQGVQDKIDNQINEAVRQTQEQVNPDMDALVTVELKNGTQVQVLGGTIASLEDGSIDKEGSTPIVIFEDGARKVVPAKDIQSIISNVPSQEAIERVKAEVELSASELEASEIEDEVLPSPFDDITLDDFAEANEVNPQIAMMDEVGNTEIAKKQAELSIKYLNGELSARDMLVNELYEYSEEATDERLQQEADRLSEYWAKRFPNLITGTKSSTESGSMSAPGTEAVQTERSEPVAEGDIEGAPAFDINSLPKKKDGSFDYAQFTPEERFRYTESIDGTDVAIEDLTTDIEATQAEIEAIKSKITKAKGSERIALRENLKTKEAELSELASLLPGNMPQKEAQNEVAPEASNDVLPQNNTPTEPIEAPQIPVDKEGNVDYKAIADVDMYAEALRSEFEEEDALEIVSNNLTSLDGEVKGLSKIKDVVARKRAEKKIKENIQFFEDVRSKLQTKEIAPVTAEQKQAEKAVIENEIADNKTQFPNITERWEAAEKHIGNKDEIILPNGEKVAGTYVLTDASAPTPSHNPFNNFAKSEGFPVTDSGKTINDRDYEADKNAQIQVEQRAGIYDQRALQTPVIVSNDGVVISGNDRTMSGQLAAQRGTDNAYNDYLRNNAGKYGFSPEQVASISNPRVVFVPDATPSYSTETFAKFNKEDKKTQNKTEKAVAHSKTLKPETIGKLARIMDDYDTLDKMYDNPRAVKEIVSALQRDGVIGTNEIADMIDGDILSGSGRDFVENLVIGGILGEKAIRQLNGMRDVRQAIVKSATHLVSNKKLGDYSLSEEINDAIDLVYNARKQGMRPGETVDMFMRTQSMFDESPIDLYGETVQMLANTINKGQSFFKKVVTSYNERGLNASAGQSDIFTGEVESKDQIIKDALKLFGYEQGTRTTKTERTGTEETGNSEKETGNAETSDEGSGTEVNSAIASAEANVDTNPTQAQKEAGNYRMGHVEIDGHNITIENPKGSVRSGVDASGKEWSVEMKYTYGYIKGTKGKDGDHIDIFLSDNPTNGNVFVVDQVNKDGSFDEHKVMYGFESIDDAREAYLSNYEKGWTGLGNITEVSKENFGNWLASGTRKMKPFAEYKSVQNASELIEKESGQQIVYKAIEAIAKSENEQIPSFEEVCESLSDKASAEKTYDVIAYFYGNEFTDSINKGEFIELFSNKGSDSKYEIAKSKQTKESDLLFRENNIEIDPFILQYYKEGMAERHTGKASSALGAMRRMARDQYSDMNFLDFKKLWNELQERVFAEYGDYREIEKEEASRIEEQNRLMQAAQEKADKEAQELKKRISEFESMDDSTLDNEYFKAVETGNDVRIRDILNEVAKRKGYSISDEHKMSHRAPAYNRNYEKGETPDGDVNIVDISNGISNQPTDYFDNPHDYMYDTKEGMESHAAITKAVGAIKKGGNPLVTVYRAVPKSTKESSVRNGDWVTLSKSYAESHGNNVLGGKHRIIEEQVPASDIYWDGNDINEWGVDNKKDYAYKNAKNNKKLNDLITKNDKGEIIPPSKRFNSRVSDERFREENKTDTQIKEGYTQAANELASELGIEIEILSKEDLPDGHKRAQGYFNSRTGKIAVCPENHASAEDVRRTIFHEAVGHKGLRGMYGKGFDNFLDETYQNASEAVRRKINTLASRRGWNIRLATEEYLADQAEKGFDDNLFSTVKQLFNGMIAKAKQTLGFKLSDADIKYVLWKSYRNLKGKGSSVFSVAEDVAMKYRLFRDGAEEAQIISNSKKNGTYMKAPNGKPTNLTEKQWVQVRTQAFKSWFGDWQNTPANASKVVDDNGEPLVVFHGTSNGKFDVFGKYKSEAKTPKGAHFFTKSKAIAESYSADENGNMTDSSYNFGVFLNIRNIATVDFEGRNWRNIPLETRIINTKDSSLIGGVFNSKEEASEYLNKYIPDNNLSKEEAALLNIDTLFGKKKGLNTDEYAEKLLKSNKDGIEILNISDSGNIEAATKRVVSTDYIVKNSNQIKSATDNNGEFNPDNNDIRYRQKAIKDYGSEISELKAKIRDSKADIKLLAEQITNVIDGKLKPDIAQEMSKTEISALLRAIKSAVNKESLYDAIKYVEGVLNQVEINKNMKELLALSKLKVKDKNNKGVSVAKTVDQGTQMVMNDIRTSFNNLLVNECDREARRFGREASTIEKSLDKLSEEEKPIAENKAKELRQKQADMKQQADDLRKERKEESRENIQKRMEYLEEKMDQAVQNGEHFSKDDAAEYDSLPVKLKFIEAQDMASEIEQIDRDMANLLLNINTLKKERAQARKNGKDVESFDNKIKSIEAEIIEMKQDRLTLQEDLIKVIQEAKESLKEIIETGKSSLKHFNEIKRERKMQIAKMGVQAVSRNRIKGLNENTTRWEEVKEKMKPSIQMMKSFAMAPLSSFNFMLKYIDKNNRMGEGDLYNHFMKSDEGVFAANNRLYKGQKAFKEDVKGAIERIFGKPQSKVFKESKTTTTIINLITDNGTVESKITKGQGLYIWLVWRMDDGQAKLMKQGYTSETMAQIEGFIGEDYMRFGEWVTEEFLPELRDTKYNPVHERLFGAPMASREHYFPFDIAKRDIRKDEDVSEETYGQPSTVTGNIINRTRNKNRINTEKNAFDKLLEHGMLMEEWAALAEVRQDFNGLLSNRYFRNLMEANEEGSFEALKKSGSVALRSYNDFVGAGWEKSLNKVFKTLNKALAGGAIAFRINTALKQLLSYPAFMGYSMDPMFAAHLLNSTAPAGVGKKGIRENYVSNFKWAVENIPSFEERVAIGDTGNEHLRDNTFKLMDKFVSVGMLPNRLVDALTCSIGIRAIYDYTLSKYKKTMSEEEAHNLALYEAGVAFNETQQSSRPEFMAPIQVSSHWVNKSFTNFQTSNIGFARKWVEAMLNLATRNKVEKQKMYRGLISNGMTPGEAVLLSNKAFVANQISDLKNFALFAFGMNTLWAMGGVGLLGFTASMLGSGGDDDWYNEEQISTIKKGVATAPIMGMIGLGTFLQTKLAGNDYSPIMLFNSLNDMWESTSSAVDEAGVVSYPVAMQILKFAPALVGFNPQTFENLYLGMEGAIKDGNVDLIDVMFMLNSPESQRKAMADKMYKDLGYEEYAKKVSRAYKYLDKKEYPLLPGRKPLTKKRQNEIAMKYSIESLPKEEQKEFKESLKKGRKARKVAGNPDYEDVLNEMLNSIFEE